MSATVRFAAAVLAGVLAFLCALSPAKAMQIDTPARNAVIMDGETGRILFGKNADVPIPPASMSKLMTAAVVLDLIEKGEISGDTLFDVSEKAWRTGGSKMFVLVDTQIRVEDLMKGLIIVSGNDAAVVLAENIAGSEAAFATLMNERARALGLRQSTFSNPTGLDEPGQRMSAADIARLARILRDRYPQWRSIFAQREFTWSDIPQTNRNPLLASFEGADGMKTGHTDEAGYSLVASAGRDGAQRIIVLTGLESATERSREAYRMMRVAFDEFRTATFFKPGEIIGEADVFGGKQETVPLRLESAVRYTKHRDVLRGASAKIVIPRSPLVAPVRAGEQVAELRVSLPGEEDEEYPVYAAVPVNEKGVFAKMGLGLKILFTPPEEPILP